MVIADGRKFVAETDERFDAIIVDSSEPIGPSAVLHTRAFFADCKRALKEGGILITQNGLPFLFPDHLAETTRAFASLFDFVAPYMCTQPCYFGGPFALNWASDEDDHLEIAEKKLAKRQQKRGIETRYWTPAVHNAAFALPAYAQAVTEKAIAEARAEGGKSRRVKGKAGSKDAGPYVRPRRSTGEVRAEQAVVDLQRLQLHGVEREGVHHVGARALTHRGPLGRRQRQGLGDSLGEAHGVRRRYEPAGCGIAADAGRAQHGLGRSADVGGDDRRAHRLRLRGGTAEGFGLRRGDDCEVGCEKGRRHVVDVAGEAKVPIEPCRADRLQQRRPVAAAPLRIAGEHERPRRRAGRCSCNSRAASMSTLWPFHAVSRAACSTTRASAPTCQSLRRAERRAGATCSGSNVRGSTPR